MHTSRSRLFLLLMPAMMAGRVGSTQEIAGALEGRILASDRLPLAGVEVVATGPGGRSTSSDGRGYFRFLALPIGVYSLAIRHVGYRPVRFEQIRIRLGRTTLLPDARLEPQAVELQEVVVSGGRPAIDPTSTSIGGNLARERYETLPVDRTYVGLVTLVPGASTSHLGDELNVQGGTGLENNYFIDGVNVADPFGHRVLGTGLPWNFIREVEVRTGGYEAQYRGSLGGVLNVVTQRGGSRLAGQAFAFGVHNRFTGESRFGVIEPRSRNFVQYDVGASLGGPLVRDRLWFFAAYNPSVQREEVLVPGLGFSDDRSTSHLFAGKVTWQPGEQTEFDITTFGDPTYREAVGAHFTAIGTPAGFANPDPFLGDLRTGGVTVTIQGRHAARNGALLQASVSRFSQIEVNRGLTSRGRAEPLFIDTNQVWSGGYPDDVDLPSVRTAVSVTSTVPLGRHTVKGGAEYVDNRLSQNVFTDAIVQFGDSAYRRFNFDFSGTVHSRIPSVFLQDSWLLEEGLRLNVGVRWDGQYLIDSDGRVALRIVDQIQPRVGLVQQLPGASGVQKLFLSYGRFSQDLSTQLSSVFHDYTGTLQFLDYDHDPRLDPSGADTAFAVSPRPVPRPDVEGQHYDEWVFGYERELGGAVRGSIRGIHRRLRQAIEDGFDADAGRQTIGNPGRGALRAYPKAHREYTAVEVTAETSGEGRGYLVASYVLSRSYGNYTGLFNSDLNIAFANLSSQLYDFPGLTVNATGLLPNDRPHVFKLAGAYSATAHITAGASFLWQSGTPLSEFGATPYGFPWVAFLRQRGTAGRSPALWDLNVRMSYDFARTVDRRGRPRVLLDLFHVGSQREPVSLDQVHYNCLDGAGNQSCPNPNYRKPTRYQPPMSARLGVVVDF
jgi:hypothetical protein